MNSVKALGDYSIRIEGTELTAYTRGGVKKARRYYPSEPAASKAYKAITSEKKLVAWIGRNAKTRSNPYKAGPGDPAYQGKEKTFKFSYHGVPMWALVKLSGHDPIVSVFLLDRPVIEESDNVKVAGYSYRAWKTAEGRFKKLKSKAKIVEWAGGAFQRAADKLERRIKKATKARSNPKQLTPRQRTRKAADKVIRFLTKHPHARVSVRFSDNALRSVMSEAASTRKAVIQMLADDNIIARVRMRNVIHDPDSFDGYGNRLYQTTAAFKDAVIRADLRKKATRSNPVMKSTFTNLGKQQMNMLRFMARNGVNKKYSISRDAETRGVATRLKQRGIISVDKSTESWMVWYTAAGKLWAKKTFNKGKTKGRKR